MNLTYEIKPENLKLLEIKQIALDKEKFGTLTFDKAYPLLDKLRTTFVEFEELGYQSLLTPTEISDVDHKKERLVNYVQRIHDYNLTDPSFNITVRDTLETEIEGFYNTTSIGLRNYLVFLRQETARKSSDVKELEKQQKAAAEAQREYESLKNNLQKELDELKNRRVELESKKGELVAIGLGKDFEDQSFSYKTEAENWLEKRNRWFWVLFAVIGINALVYIVLVVSFSLSGGIQIDPDSIFTWQYVLAKIALIILLSYAIGFSSRNYNISSGLAASNRHRKNVAETMLNALSSNMDENAKAEISREAASAMFKHLPIGYINKEHQSDSGPILEIVKKFPKEN